MSEPEERPRVALPWDFVDRLLTGVTGILLLAFDRIAPAKALPL